MGRMLAVSIAMILVVCTFAVADERVEVPLDNDGVQRQPVLAGGYFFRPRHIVVKANRPVELMVSKKSGFVPHNFALSIPSGNIRFDEDLGTDPRVIRFTVREPGRYDFYCSKKLLFFESHREKGMEGVLEVVE